MKILTVLFTAFLITACAAKQPDQASAGQEVAVAASSEVLTEATHSWDGGDFTYPEGDAQLTVTRILIPADVSLPMHCHPVPLGGVLTKGTLEVTKEDGQTLLLEQDAGLIEVSNQWHYGRALEDVEIIVVYAGAEGIPVTVLKDGDPQLVAKCR